MAIVECEECGGKVSTRAAACPHCGSVSLEEEWERPEPRRHVVSHSDTFTFWMRLIFGLILVAPLALALLWGLGAGIWEIIFD